MKKRIAALLAAVMLMGILTACGDDQKAEPKPTTTTKPPTTTTTSSTPLYYVTADPTLNVRSAPTTEEQNVIGRLAYGTEVKVLEEKDGWCRITPSSPHTVTFASAVCA